MRIRLKLFAGLSAYLPPDARHNTAEVEVTPGTTPHQVIDLYRIPRDQAHLVIAPYQKTARLRLVRIVLLTSVRRKRPSEAVTVTCW